MTKVNFYDSINDSMLKFAVIIAVNGRIRVPFYSLQVMP